MKRISMLFLLLLTVFFTAWGVKARNPINRPDNLQEETEAPWYEARYSAPKADSEWVLDPEIPLNYIPVPGEDELYMVVDDSGKITGYRQRTQLADGSWVWKDINPDIPENYEAVDGLENVYRVKKEDGTTEYYLYVRNEDDTFCFVPVDEKGNPLDDGKDAEKIDKSYVHVTGNVYAVYNDENVKMGYRKRTKGADGTYVWNVCEAPDISQDVGNSTGMAVQKPSGNTEGSKTLVGSSGSNKTQNADGTYTVTEKNIHTETKNGYTITYQTDVASTYNKNGKLISTKKNGPYEVSKVAAGGSSAVPDKNKIAGSLDKELARVSGSVNFNRDKANQVLAKLNAERKSQGIPALSMSSSSEAYKIACIRAADMAIYDHCGTSPMYGGLKDLISRYWCTTSNPSENIWKADIKSAAQIHTRFQANEGSRKVRMSDGYSEVGIAIVEKNNQLYIAEVYLR